MTEIIQQLIIILIGAAINGSATYFLVDLLVDEDGPFNIFARIRLAAGINVPVDTGSYSYGEENIVVSTETELESDGSFWAEVLSCGYCTTPYVAFVLVGLFGLIFSVGLVNLFFMWLCSCGISYWWLD